MHVNRKIQLQLRLHNLAFITLLLAMVGLLAWLSTQYVQRVDWTATARHTLSAASVEQLRAMHGPVEITAFVPDSPELRRTIADFVQRYQRHKHDISLQFVNPDLEPQRVRELQLQPGGELLLSYAGRTERAQALTEEALTNALQRLLRGGERRIRFLTGHGERHPQGQANHDLGNWAAQLSAKGLIPEPLNLGTEMTVAPDTALLVIASPQVDLLAGEVELIRRYVAEGGNLLWLQDPGELQGLDMLAVDLGLEFLPGVVVDPTTRLLGIDHPAIAIVASYGSHPVTRDLAYLTVFPEAVGLEAAGGEWEAVPLLETVPRSWSETGALQGVIQYDEGTDIPGPLTLGVALSRPHPQAEAAEDEAATQRVVVIGDGDFLSNTYLGNQGNLELGMRVLNWLSHDDHFVGIPSRPARDVLVTLSPAAWIAFGLAFLVLLPLALLGGGGFIWLRRRRL